MKARCGGGGKPRRASSSPTNAAAAAVDEEKEEAEEDVGEVEEEEEAVYRVPCSCCGRPGGRAPAKKRTAPAGRVGWRFRHDSLGRHAFLHF